MAKPKKRPKPARRARKRRAAKPAVDAGAAQAPKAVVGIGASAGGLEAFTQLLQALPADLGMAVVVVQHLAPQHESALPSLLNAVSPLPVVQVAEGMHVKPNCVYVIPPNARLTLDDGELHLAPRPLDRTQYNPIDLFFRSLAESARERAIAVVLSGTGSDGAAGIREIKAAGGITMAQRPDSARYDGMPSAAIATEMVDFVATPTKIAAELTQIARHPYVANGGVEAAAPNSEENGSTAEEQPPLSDSELRNIFTHLRSVSGVDFGQYKLGTVRRRLHRRMALRRITRVPDYLEVLREHPSEVLDLYHDLLIHVTRFFREPEAFETLRTVVLPEILARRNDDAPIRIWVAGCATGEEAYSIAIELLEFLSDRPQNVPVQIFATDVSEPAIEQARQAFYPPSIADDVSPERLRRFFTRVDGGYRIAKPVRDACVFARQDLARDPPFSRLDLILCRNVLIYLNTPLQRRLMNVFHYALKSSGWLMLGQAETIGPHSDLFAIADKRNRIYAKKVAEVSPSVSFQLGPHPAVHARPRRTTVGRDDTRTIHSEANRALLERQALAGVVVDGDFEIVQFTGQTGRYLEAPAGEPSHSILSMAREGLLYGLRTALQAARKSHAPVRREGLHVRGEDGSRGVNLEILPLSLGDGRRHYLVLFEEVQPGKPSRKSARAKASARPRRGKQRASVDDDLTQLARLQQELAASREHLQSIIQELEGANEELQSANEEILSSNEELQSTNEELDTAREELQSTNEELNTVNEELHGRNEELSHLNSDLVNLLDSVEIAIVIVASDLRIRRFTPMAGRVLNLIAADIGRPISHIKPNVDCPDLEAVISRVIDRVEPQERDVRDAHGNWFSMRVRPYKNLENRIDGAVLSLYDVSVARRHEQELREARQYAQTVVETLSNPVVLLDRDLRVRTVNRAFATAFGIGRESVEGKSLFQLSGGAWDVPELRATLERPVVDGEQLPHVEIAPTFPRVGAKPLTVTLSWFKSGPDEELPSVLLAIQERTA